MNEKAHRYDFSDEIAIVTGASSGIGRAIAVQLAEAGAKIAAFARSEDKLAALASEYPDRIIAVAGDASSEEDIRLLVDTTRAELGGCTLLVNNAGHIEPKPVIEMTTEEWDAHFHINTRAAFLASKFVLYDMVTAKHGNIVNISSISGVPGPEKFPGFAAYAASKAALIAFTELLAVEVKENGIRVNAISPGSVSTPMLKRVAPSLETDVTPDDIARLVLFVASPGSRAINGQNLTAYSA